MAHLATENVIVFPIAKERASSVQETRLMTEYNVSNIIRQLMGNEIKGFIISCSTKDSGWEIEFNLYGYYFRINVENTWINDTFGTDISNGIFASIILDTLVDEIDGQDADGLYKGLHITNVEPKDVPVIKLLTCDNQGKLICATNKFGLINMSIGGIDGKYK